MGEEPYSVAILMDELLTHPYLGHWTQWCSYCESQRRRLSLMVVP